MDVYYFMALTSWSGLGRMDMAVNVGIARENLIENTLGKLNPISICILWERVS